MNETIYSKIILTTLNVIKLQIFGSVFSGNILYSILLFFFVCNRSLQIHIVVLTCLINIFISLWSMLVYNSYITDQLLLAHLSISNTWICHNSPIPDTILR